ncbi:nicotinamide amidase [Dermatophagoides farinae]|uniref:nicotinamidase n=1 Tax=Dermatophagoides farinae TaxID=6954 RepID=A0A922IFW5_DERFA|nr:hypothetical protein DERF_002566 [Dermatophagoides farinae]
MENSNDQCKNIKDYYTPFVLSDYLEDTDAVSPILDKPNITNGHQASQTVRRWALIIVDVQNDFVNGSMSLKNFFNGEEAAEVIPAINRLLQYVKFDLIVYSRDCHPFDHCSFISSSVTPKAPVQKWPEHCVENTWGAQYAAGLITEPQSLNPTVKKISIMKGLKRDEECFSAFRGTLVEHSLHQSSQTLQEIIKNEKIDQIFVCGLATDYCVRETCHDARNFCQRQETFVLVDASRGVKPFHPLRFLEIDVKMITTDRLIQSVLIHKEKILKLDAI